MKGIQWRETNEYLYKTGQKMDAKTERKQYSSLDVIERLLSHTTLSTQRVTHANIIDIGESVLHAQTTHETDDNQKEIDAAVESVRKQAAKELQEALRKLRDDMETDKEHSLQSQKEYFEKLNKRISEQRDKAEEERLRELTKKLTREKDMALRRHVLESEEARDRAVTEACQNLRKRMFAECADERDRAVKKGVQQERESCRLHEEEMVKNTRQECGLEAERERNKLTSRHQRQMKDLTNIYTTLQNSYAHLFQHCRQIESDFKALQDDYSRFMDYTDGKFHSDYLMDLRSHGMILANQEVPIYKCPDNDDVRNLVTGIVPGCS